MAFGIFSYDHFVYKHWERITGYIRDYSENNMKTNVSQDWNICDVVSLCLDHVTVTSRFIASYFEGPAIITLRLL